MAKSLQGLHSRTWSRPEQSHSAQHLTSPESDTPEVSHTFFNLRKTETLKKIFFNVRKNVRILVWAPFPDPCPLQWRTEPTYCAIADGAVTTGPLGKPSTPHHATARWAGYSMSSLPLQVQRATALLQTGARLPLTASSRPDDLPPKPWSDCCLECSPQD